jgi:hypothetical protein
MAAVPWSETAVSQTESSEKSSLSITDPIPGFISRVAVNVGNVFNVGVADGGNQIMVAVGCGVSVGMGVSVGGIEVDGRQALMDNVITRRMIFSTKQSPSRTVDCFVADTPRNDR